MQFAEKRFDGNKRLLYAWFLAMHSRVDLVLIANDERTNLGDIARKTEKEIGRIEAFANRFDEHSELSLLNRKANFQVVPVSEELFGILADCQLFHGKSSGYFDITINSKKNLPDGMNFLELNPEERSVKYQHPDLLLDLSGYLKGYALDKVVEQFKISGIENVLVNFGNSSVCALGNHPHGKGWKINSQGWGLDSDPVLCDECLTTSGYREEREWPVRNPLTGRVISESPPVSVITADPAIGEVVSTVACLTRGNEQLKLLEQFNARLAQPSKIEKSTT